MQMLLFTDYVIMRKLFLFLLLASTVQLQAQTDHSSFLEPRQAPDASRYLPAPPDTTSVAFLYDYSRYQWGRAQRVSARGRQADFDSYWQPDSIMKGFARSFGLLITKQTAPVTYELISKVCEDAELGVIRAKKRYMRKRPYVQFNDHPADRTQEEELRFTGSYPSGHSARGWATALILSELRPSKQNEILKRGYDYGESRVIEGYHYQSDVEASRLAASAVVARLHADAAFMRQLDKARKELAPLFPDDYSQYRLTDYSPLVKEAKEFFQGLAVSGDYLVSLQNKGYATIYRLPHMKRLTKAFKLGSFGEYNHANVASFGTEKYAKTDALPLLYVSQAHRKKVDSLKNVCYVERLRLDGSSELVQRIVLDSIERYYGYALQWAIDRDRNRLIGFGNTLSNLADGNRFRIIVFKLPRLSDGRLVRLHPREAIDNYIVQDFDDRYPSKVIGQGACVYQDCLFMPTGYGKEATPSIVYVWDLRKKELRSVLDLSEAVKHELEDIDFYKGNALIQTNGEGIIMLKYR